MGIEPTNPCSRSGPTGFEDQARHQTGSTSEIGLSQVPAAVLNLLDPLDRPDSTHPKNFVRNPHAFPSPSGTLILLLFLYELIVGAVEMMISW
jgi:hypothetical protein